MSEPRSLNWIKTYVEDELSAASKEADVTINKAVIAWDSYDHSFVVKLTDVNVLQESNQQILATFDSVKLGISLLSILSGNFGFSEVNIIKPAFHVMLENVSASQDKPTKEWLKGLTPFLTFLTNKENFQNNSLPKRIRVTDGKIFINNGVNILAWQMPQAYLIANDTEIQGEFTIDFGNTSSVFSLSSREYLLSTMPAVTISTENFPSYILAELIPDVEMLANIDVVLSANARIGVADNYEPKTLMIEISKAEGNISLDEYFPTSLSLKSLNVDASYDLDDKQLTVKSMEAEFPDVTFNVNGVFQNLATWSNPDFIIDTEVKIRDVKTDLLQLYWPKTLGVEARTWVATNLRSGKIPSAKGRFVIKEGQYHAPSISQEMINATVEFEEAIVRLPRPLTRATNAYGSAFFDGKQMKVKVDKALFQNSSIKNATVAIPDWSQEPDLMLHISGDVEGPATDLMDVAKMYIEKSGVNKPLDNAAFSMDKVSDITGNADTKFDISLPLKNDIELSDINLEINSKLNNVSAKSVYKNFPIEKINADVNVSSNQVKVSGSAELLASKFNANFTIPFTESMETIYSISSPTRIKTIETIFERKIPYIKENVQLNVNGKVNANTHLVDVSLNAKDAIIDVPELNFLKNKGDNLTLKLNAKISESGSTQLSDVIVESSNLKFKANANLDDSGALSQFDANNFLFKKNNLSSLSYKSSDSKVLILKGKSLDFSEIDFNAFKSPDKKEEPSIFRNLELKADIANFYYKNNSVFRDVKADVICKKDFCGVIDIYSKFSNDKYVVVNLKPTGNRHTLMVESDDAGALINALDISKNVRDGRLIIQAVVHNDNDVLQANGSMSMEKFQVVKTSILGKLLTLASFSGIRDLLQGDGILFNKFEAPFVYNDGVVTVSDARSSGSSIGITGGGTIDTNNEVLNINGTLVPAQVVNDLVNSIPVVGDFITSGGKEGIIAANYTVKGPFSDIDVSVNPLSIVTPGILRKLFDIFPSSAPTPANKNEPLSSNKKNAEGVTPEGLSIKSQEPKSDSLQQGDDSTMKIEQPESELTDEKDTDIN